MLREGAFLHPFAVAAEQDYNVVAQGAEILTAEVVGAVQVTRTPGKPLDPFAPLHGDPSATSYGPIQPPVTVRVVHGGKQT